MLIEFLVVLKKIFTFIANLEAESFDFVYGGKDAVIKGVSKVSFRADSINCFELRRLYKNRPYIIFFLPWEA